MTARAARAPGRVAAGLLPCLVVSVLACACASAPARVDRTGGISLEVRWTSAGGDRIGYYALDRDGTFASAGGFAARDGTRQYTTPLASEEIGRCLELLRATNPAERPREHGASGDRTDVTVVDASGRTRFSQIGPDSSVDALREHLRGLSLRQFRDVLDAQPAAGERRTSR